MSTSPDRKTHSQKPEDVVSHQVAARIAIEALAHQGNSPLVDEAIRGLRQRLEKMGAPARADFDQTMQLALRLFQQRPASWLLVAAYASRVSGALSELFALDSAWRAARLAERRYMSHYKKDMDEDDETTMTRIQAEGDTMLDLDRRYFGWVFERWPVARKEYDTLIAENAIEEYEQDLKALEGRVGGEAVPPLLRDPLEALASCRDELVKTKDIFDKSQLDLDEGRVFSMPNLSPEAFAKVRESPEFLKLKVEEAKMRRRAKAKLRRQEKKK